MKTRRAYFSTGEVIEVTGSKRHFKRICEITVRSGYPWERVKTWFKPSEEWKKAEQHSREVLKEIYPGLFR